MKKLYSYTNGNYNVSIFRDGTKVRETNESEFKPEYPESIDLKVTNRCDIGCPYCHEKSTPYGKIGDLSKMVWNLQGLPQGVEIAIGGGNPLSYPYLVELLISLAKYSYIANITVNAKHLPEYDSFLESLIACNMIHGVGVSYDGEHFFGSDNTVYHVIAGIHTLEDITKLITSNRKVLILGYKYFGRGKHYYNLEIERKIRALRNSLWEVIGKGTISFDNLAIEQLEVRDHFTYNEWSKFYMGDDGGFTMYYDAVEQYYAPSSISTIQANADILLKDYFKSIVTTG